MMEGLEEASETPTTKLLGFSCHVEEARHGPLEQSHEPEEVRERSSRKERGKARPQEKRTTIEWNSEESSSVGLQQDVQRIQWGKRATP